MSQNHLTTVDWNAIKEGYLEGQTARMLAEANGITAQMVYKKARAEGWQREKEHMDATIAQRLIDKFPMDLARLRPDIVQELSAIALSDIADYLFVDDDGVLQLKPFSQMPKGATRCIKVVKERKRVSVDADGNKIVESQIEYTLLDKLKALETLAKITGLFSENITVNHMPQVIAIQGLNTIENI